MDFLKQFLITLVFLTSTINLVHANSVIKQKGVSISAGDKLQEIYEIWGKPNYHLQSARTCNRILKLKREYCSSSRKVWKRGRVYWMVQYSGSMIIKIDWTRFESQIRDKL